MRLFKILFWCLWRIWFYCLAIIPIIVLFPLVLLSLSKESWYPFFFKIARFWAHFILWGSGFYYSIKAEQKIEPHKSYMFIANHTSMTDIMLMLAVVKNPFVFVGKKELEKIPIFGLFYKRAVISVDRDCPKSRIEVYEHAQRRIGQKLSICIFPEGKVPDDESVVLDSFKGGAFNLAIEHKLPIVPMTFYDNKERFSFTFLSGAPGRLRVKIHSFLETDKLKDSDKKTLREQARDIILHELKSDKAYMKTTLKAKKQ